MRGSALAAMAVALALGNASISDANQAYGLGPDFSPEWQRAKRSRWGSKLGHGSAKKRRARVRNKIAARSRARNR